MNWKELFTMQAALDQYIVDKHALSDKNLFEKKYLALLVELGELANETRCFKFWSTKSRNESSVILEEYVDNIHFILSLGIEKGYILETIQFEVESDSETAQFNNVFAACTLFYEHPSVENYKNLFKRYLQLGKTLGFNEKDIQKAYKDKNEINYERQQAGY
ncbi:dUTP diphosphatase [Virgibacillus sp. W0430]|uniref:dUTP diphosphatase n=1 Tax=Virgibacillus sp. W0430 TaxID=3391580 RepID=UPI003F4783DB